MTNNNDTDIIAQVMTLLARNAGFASTADAKAMTPSFEGFPTDCYQWGSGPEDHISIYWEEGPEDWAYDIPEVVNDYLRGEGLFAEAMRSWCIGIYSI